MRLRKGEESTANLAYMQDWRVENAERLRELGLRRKEYRKWSVEWDHDHCAACWAKFAESDGPDIQHEGYTTREDYTQGANYEWVCVTCFSELKDEMRWFEVHD